MSDIIVEVNGTNDGLTLIKGDSRIQLTLDELNEVRKKINFMDYREDVYMVLTERDHLECYFDEGEYDIDQIIADVESGENDEALTDIMSYYGDLREEHSTGDPASRTVTLLSTRETVPPERMMMYLIILSSRISLTMTTQAISIMI